MSREKEYTGFVVIEGYLLKRAAIQGMYLSIMKILPLVHSVFAVAVFRNGTQGDRILLLQFMNIDSDIRDVYSNNKYGPIGGVSSADDNNHNDNDHLKNASGGCSNFL
jgi:hypothetical protein